VSLAVSSLSPDTQILVDWIVRTRPEQIDMRELVRKDTLPRLNRCAILHAAARDLVSLGWLARDERTGKRGRPSRGYHVDLAKVDSMQPEHMTPDAIRAGRIEAAVTRWALARMACGAARDMGIDGYDRAVRSATEELVKAEIALLGLAKI
jgi:hypothetical protein